MTALTAIKVAWFIVTMLAVLIWPIKTRQDIAALLAFLSITLLLFGLLA